MDGGKKKKKLKQRLYATDGECERAPATSGKRLRAHKEGKKSEKVLAKRQRVADEKLGNKVEQRAAEKAAAAQAAREEESARLKGEGNELFLAGEHGAAAEKYREALGVDGENHVLHSNLAACLMELQQWGEVEAAAKRCVELEPSFVKGHYRYAAALKEQGKDKQAARAARAGINEVGPEPGLRAIRDECEAALAALPQAPLPERSFNERAIMLPDERVTHPGVIKRRKGQMLLASTSKGSRSEKQLRNKKCEDRLRKTKRQREYHMQRTKEHLDAWDQDE
jgi:hypothetical protein